MKQHQQRQWKRQNQEQQQQQQQQHQQRHQITTIAKIILQCLLISCYANVKIVTANENTSVNPCQLCPVDNTISAPDNIALPDGTTSCREIALVALFADDNQDECYDYYRFIGYAKCNCIPPSDSDTSDTNNDTDNNAMIKCNLCPEGKVLETPGAIFDDITTNTTCNEAYNYLIHYKQTQATCDYFQQTGNTNCPCIDYDDALPNTSRSSTGDSNSGTGQDNTGMGVGLGLGLSAAAFLVVGGVFMKKRKRNYSTSTKSKISGIARNIGSGSIYKNKDNTDERSIKKMKYGVFVEDEEVEIFDEDNHHHHHHHPQSNNSKYDIRADDTIASSLDGSKSKTGKEGEVGVTNSSSTEEMIPVDSGSNIDTDERGIRIIHTITTTPTTSPDSANNNTSNDDTESVFRMEEARHCITDNTTRTTDSSLFPISLQRAFCFAGGNTDTVTETATNTSTNASTNASNNADATK